MEWKNIYRGMIMGASDIVPGVSGGTIAVLLGIYDQFIGAINGIFSRDWKKHLSFLVPLAIGVAAAILTLGRIMDRSEERRVGKEWRCRRGEEDGRKRVGCAVRRR